MSTAKNSKKNVAGLKLVASEPVTKVTTAAGVTEVTMRKPSLADLVAGKGDAVAKAVAEKAAAKAVAIDAQGNMPLPKTVGGLKVKAEKAPAKTAKKAAAKVEKAPAKAAKKAPAKAEKKAAKKSGSGALIRELLAKGMDTEAILAAVHKAFPDSKAKAGDVAWNKWKMNSDK